MDNNKKIVFTGGGSSGHVTPNLAIIKKCQVNNWQCFYIGSKFGIEQELIAEIAIPYSSISTGKLRRYFSWQNFLDLFRINLGIIQAYIVLSKIKPDAIFSKGGFVAVPVVIAAWLHRIPVIIHESDFTLGLANKICLPFAKKICLAFEQTKKRFKKQDKLIVTGTPIRSNLFVGEPSKGRNFCGFKKNKKIILISGGGLGAQSINKIIRELLPQLLKQFQIIHICGKGKVDDGAARRGYKQVEYLSGEYANVLACADLVISRSGANSLAELIALQKPNILIPLPKNSSRGDQIFNAKYAAALGYSRVIFEQDLTPEKLLAEIAWVDKNSEEIITNLAEYDVPDSVGMICELLENINTK